jgi:hypothetical protein
MKTANDGIIVITDNIKPYLKEYISNFSILINNRRVNKLIEQINITSKEMTKNRYPL